MRGMIRWDTSLADMAQTADGYIDQLGEAVYQTGVECGEMIADDARATHRWTNRTGEAEASIYSEVERIGTIGVRIIVGGRAKHVIYLERRWGGRYAGITPALQRGAPMVMSRMRELVH